MPTGKKCLPQTIRTLKLAGDIRTDGLYAQLLLHLWQHGYFESTNCLFCGRALGFLPQQWLQCVIEQAKRSLLYTFFFANISSA